MISKSDFVKYLQCKKFLWLYKHRKDLLPEDIDKNLQKIFDDGYLVESYAYGLFPKGVNAQVDGFRESIFKTKKLMQEKTPVIFQPTVLANDLCCRGDIIKLNEDGERWDIYEVKGSTDVKDIHIHDLAFQKTCFEEMGFKVGELFVIFVNKEYVRRGEVDIEKFLKTRNVTEEVEYILLDTRKEVESAFGVIKQREEPDVRILKQCRNPYQCTFLDYCWKDIPKSSIYDIARNLNEEKLNMLIDEGIIEIKDIPDDVFKSEHDIRHHHVAKHDTVHIEKENIEEELGRLEYPLYFLDYETYSTAVPMFDGYKPYQQMPFQYSLHVQEEPGGELKHYEYLAKDYEDPARKLAEDLSKRIGEKGSVISWYMPFEKGRNSEMGDAHPEFAEFFNSVNERMFDLMLIFKNGHYVHKDFRCSASLKKVLPVIVPELSYKELGINEGGTASTSWGEMIKDKTSAEEKERIYNDLLKYCELDTLAMVKILEKLREVK
ncbi:MAG: DUF2779 domain-containing protein [Parcubacteria group bacterium]|nr:DUF2779 domain-containing protein [Parcubacteria group bacterium]